MSSDKDSHGNGGDENYEDVNADNDDMLVTWPSQVREELARSLLVLEVVVMTDLIIMVVMMMMTVMGTMRSTMMIMTMVKRPAPQALARPGDFVLFLLGMLMFT